LTSTPLRELLGRQTGMYRFTNTISDEQAFEMVKKTCAAQNCQRRILWPLTPEQPFPEDESKAQAGAIPLLCIEACPHIVSAARKSAKEAFEAKEAQRKTGGA
jgi:sirohydrochlorin cobaltochelatase